MVYPIQGKGNALHWKSCTMALLKVVEEAKKLGRDDPRRIVHSLKVGLALTLVSLFYYFKPLYEGFGVNAMWAVLTVLLVFEFSVGATFGRGLNRMLATLTGGALGVGAHRLATLSGRTGEPILIAIFVFVIDGIVTFMRFHPSLKARCDYGLLVFMLTFSLICVSGYRYNEVLHMAHDRLSTIIIGSCTSIIICICICPVWAGEDLHNLVSANMEKLGNFLEGFGYEYFKAFQDEKSRDQDKCQGYLCVLNSKNNEETMANLARWEPCHGGFRFGHPWEKYPKIATLTRQCAHKIQALDLHLHSESQNSKEIRNKIQETCINISRESGKALKELASSTRKMNRSNSANIHIANSKNAIENLKSLFKINLYWEEAVLLEMIPLAAIASLLAEVVECIEKIAEAVHELAFRAHFKSNGDGTVIVKPEQAHSHHQGTIQPVSSTDVQKLEIAVAE